MDPLRPLPSTAILRLVWIGQCVPRHDNVISNGANGAMGGLTDLLIAELKKAA
jgi:hypothetical protein